MCGFAGIVALGGGTASEHTIRRMADVLRHRGPDDSGIYTSGAVALGFRRLSILDLSPSGHQPFESDDGTLALVFNGEIYNYLELRRELQALGHTFRSTGDTEVLLHAYTQWGRDCLPRLNGMWAFLLHDRRRGVLFGSRDRFGVKPLYRHRGRDAVLFASEIKAIRASGMYEAAPDWKVASSFLHRGHAPTPDTVNATFFAGIEQVPAGSAFELHGDGKLTEWHYWSLDALDREPVGDPAREFAELFEDSVRLRMRSDVPVGVSLSGGLDSTGIIAAVARMRAASTTPLLDDSLQAFSYISTEFDESSYITETIAATNARLHRVEIDPVRLWDQLDEVLWYHDEPLHSPTALISYEIYRLAARHGVKVVLCGQGADESLAGYTSYFVDYWRTLIAGGRVGRTWREISAYSAAHGGSATGRLRDVLTYNAREAASRMVRASTRAERRRRRLREDASRWFTPDLVNRLDEPDGARVDASLDAVLRRSVELGPLPLYLRIEDRNSMAHSVEARLPFMDYRLVSLAFRLPPEWKLRGPYNKYVQREAMRGRMPEGVRTRMDKMGFPSPVRSWFRGPFYEALQDMLGSAAVRERGIYNVATIRADLERHRRGTVDVGGALFNIGQFERWLSTTSGQTIVPSAEVAATSAT
jgi:asparagine synthase (glutamine-hydrolysing)